MRRPRSTWRPDVPVNSRERPFESRCAGRTAPPNIVFILADDLGWADLGCYGNPEIETPNIDRLAAEGVRFTHAYAGSPWCSATRIALYTGQFPGRFIAGNEEPLRSHTEHNGIPHGHPTLPSLLLEVGYETAMFGKWHCGWLPWYSPLRIGFETFFGNFDGALDYFEHLNTIGQHDLWEGETTVEETGYYTWMIADRTSEWISRKRESPFYVQVNFTAPHWPWEGPEDHDVGALIRQRFETGTRGPLLHLDGGSLAKYAELVESLDHAVGQILDAIAELGHADNTIVVFCSDNGGERWSKNWPFVGEKGDIAEGGIRVPFILRWPEAVAANQVSDEPNITMDWTATLLDAAGTGPDADHPLDGSSLLPWLVDGTAYPDHDLFWRTSSQGALRRGRFKYVQDRRDRGMLGNWPRRPGTFDLLYDMTVDGRERANLAANEPELVTELRTAWERIDATLEAYAPDHPGLPGQTGDAWPPPVMSEPD